MGGSQASPMRQTHWGNKIAPLANAFLIPSPASSRCFEATSQQNSPDRQGDFSAPEFAPHHTHLFRCVTVPVISLIFKDLQKFLDWFFVYIPCINVLQGVLQLKSSILYLCDFLIKNVLQDVLQNVYEAYTE